MKRESAFNKKGERHRGGVELGMKKTSRSKEGKGPREGKRKVKANFLQIHKREGFL